MIFLGVAYALTALTFFFFPTDLVQFVAMAGRVAHLDLTMVETNDPFFTMLAVECWAILSCLCLLAAESPKTSGYAMTHLLGKVVAATGFGYAYLNGNGKSFHLVMTALEIAIGLISLAVLLRASPENEEVVAMDGAS